VPVPRHDKARRASEFCQPRRSPGSLSPSVRVEALPPELMLTFAAECIGVGLVKFCPAGTAKMKTQTIAAALALRAGDPVETALRAALISAIFVKHGGDAPVRRRKLA
jgi:hypothetical protein